VNRFAARLRSRVLSLGIRERLVLLVLAMLVPWVVLFATTYASFERDRNRDTGARLSEVAGQVSARVDDQLGAIEAILLSVAQAASTDSSGVDNNDRLLRRTRAELPPYINNLALWSVAGRNIGSSDSDLVAARKYEVASHRFFREALGKTRLAVGRPIESREAGTWSLTMARRIRQDGRIVGVASASARLDSLVQFLTVSADTTAGTIITVVDDEGAVIARAGGSHEWVGRTLVDTTLLRTLRDETAGVLTAGVDRQLGTAVAYRRVNAAPWTVLVGLPADGSGLYAEPEWKFLALFGALGLAGALFLAALVAARIADPLRKLTADAARFGTGDLTARTLVRAPGEVGTLASTFNQMASTLQARTAALAASEERHRLAARATNDVIWDWDIRTSAVDWSEGATNAFRTSPNELGDSIEWWSSRLHPEDHDATVASLTDALDSDAQIWTAEYRFRCGDGTYAEVLDRGYVLRDADGRPRRMIGSMLNLTERRAAERERDRFFSLSADMFCIASFTGQLLRVNPAFCTVLGYDADELVETRVVELIHPDDRAAAIEAARALGSGDLSQRYENRVRCKDGTY
jgi:PAS domain S-box-containing protein